MSREFNDLKHIFGIGVISATLIGEVEFIGLEMSGISIGSALIEGSEIGLLFGEISIAPIMLISLPIIMFLFPEQVNEVWMNFASLFNPYYKDYPDIPIYENTYPANIINPPRLILDGKSSDDYIISQLKNNRNFHNKY